MTDEIVISSRQQHIESIPDIIKKVVETNGNKVRKRRELWKIIHLQRMISKRGSSNQIPFHHFLRRIVVK